LSIPKNGRKNSLRGFPMVTEEQIKKIIANSLNLAVDELDNETPLQGGPIESLSYVELLLSLEESYQVVALDKELEQVKTIDDLIQLILNKINVSKCSGGGQAAREIGEHIIYASE
jgi:acyl carrier protein